MENAKIESPVYAPYEVTVPAYAMNDVVKKHIAFQYPSGKVTVVESGISGKRGESAMLLGRPGERAPWMPFVASVVANFFARAFAGIACGLRTTFEDEKTPDEALFKTEWYMDARQKSIFDVADCFAWSAQLALWLPSAVVGLVAYVLVKTAMVLVGIAIFAVETAVGIARCVAPVLLCVYLCVELSVFVPRHGVVSNQNDAPLQGSVVEPGADDQDEAAIVAKMTERERITYYKEKSMKRKNVPKKSVEQEIDEL